MLRSGGRRWPWAATLILWTALAFAPFAVEAQTVLPPQTTAPPETTAPPTTAPPETTAPPTTAAPSTTGAPASSTTAKPKPTTTTIPPTTTTPEQLPTLPPLPGSQGGGGGPSPETTVAPIADRDQAHISAFFPALSIGGFLVALLIVLIRFGYETWRLPKR